MTQQFLAYFIIVFFVARIFWQWRAKRLSDTEFRFWLVFWFLAFLAVLNIKAIDALFYSLGFSSSGIQIVFYLGVIVLFYLFLRLRLRLEKIEKEITKLVENAALEKKE